ncbi:hypothetical protein ACROYT_G042478 [Oculina patagonica]
MAFVETLGENFGYVSSLEEANKLIEDLETKSTAKFACCRATKRFGSFNYTEGSHRIFWEDNQHVRGARISFTGVPFIILGSKVYDCQHGVDRNTALKKRKRAETKVPAAKRRRVVQTRKVNCTAQIKLREVLAFPAFKINADSKCRRETASKNIREALKTGTSNPERRIYIEFPTHSDHQNHLLGEESGTCQPVDKRIINRIHELVAGGLTNVNQVRQQLEFFVKNVLFRDKELPQTTNRRFYPTTKDIRTHIFRAKVKNRESSQEGSAPADQPSSSSDTIHVSLVELPIENVCDDTDVTLTDDTNADLSDDTNVVLPDEVRGQKCLDLLEQIKQLTVAIQDEEVLGRLNSRLQEVLEEMQLFCCAGQSSDHNYVRVLHENNSTLQRENLH